MFGKDPSTVSTAELKRDILVFAKRDPKEFLNILNDPELKFQAKIRLFFENKLLDTYEMVIKKYGLILQQIKRKCYLFLLEKTHTKW
jgi:hypothetical protein